MIREFVVYAPEYGTLTALSTPLAQAGFLLTGDPVRVDGGWQAIVQCETESGWDAADRAWNQLDRLVRSRDPGAIAPLMIVRSEAQPNWSART